MSPSTGWFDLGLVKVNRFRLGLFGWLDPVRVEGSGC